MIFHDRSRALRARLAALALELLVEQLRVDRAPGGAPISQAQMTALSETISAYRAEAARALDALREAVVETSTPGLRAEREARILRAHTQILPDEIEAWARRWTEWAQGLASTGVRLPGEGRLYVIGFMEDGGLGQRLVRVISVTRGRQTALSMVDELRRLQVLPVVPLDANYPQREPVCGDELVMIDDCAVAPRRT